MLFTSLAVALVLAALAACATGERMRSVHAGMWKDEVVGLLGEPDAAQRCAWSRLD
jgi:outer membrane protein assembly factor BamE (lipoprotein component of BamABCDE complex)